MVDISIAQVRQGSPTVTGTQDFTVTGFGTPKAVLFIISSAITDGTATNHAIIGIGSTDGTRQWNFCSSSRNASASTSNFKRGMSDKCISLLVVTGAVAAEANFDSWITDGVRINWTTVAASSYLVTAILFGGVDLTARSDLINLGTSTSPQTYSSLSSEPDLVFVFGHADAADDTAVNNHLICTGFCHNNKSGTITQNCFAQVEASALADGTPISYMSDGEVFLQINTAAPGTPTYTTTFSNFTSSGFDFTCNNSGGSDDIGILALSLGGVSSKVGIYNPPTTATTSTISTSYTPQFCLLCMHGVVSVDTDEQDGDAGVFGISSMTSSAQYSYTTSIEDLSPTTDTQVISDDVAVRLVAHDGASDLYNATLSSFNSSGVNLSYSTASATTRQWMYLIIGDNNSVPTINYNTASYDIFQSFITSYQNQR